MTIHNPLFLQPIGYTVKETRHLIEAAFGAREGVIESTGLAPAVTGGGSYDVTIATGHGVVKGDTNAGQGYYLVWVDATVTKTHVPDATNPRIDYIVLSVNDATEVGSGGNGGSVDIIQGTATSGATLSNNNGHPSVPDSAILLVRVFVPTSGGVSSISDERVNVGQRCVVQTYLTPGTYTWTKPAGAQMIEVIAIGGGGGGGSARNGANATLRGGGGGGGGGGMSRRTLQASDVGVTETITVGSGGTGAAVQGSANTDGNAGGVGGASLFATGQLYVVLASNGSGGGGGTGAGGGSGGIGQATFATHYGGNGGAGGTGGGGGSPSGSTTTGPGGGGGGRGIDSGNSINLANGGGGNVGGYGQLSGNPNGRSGGIGQAGGGGQGGAPGGNGGLYGGGGGGGEYNTGVGGAGGGGAVTVITYF